MIRPALVVPVALLGLAGFAAGLVPQPTAAPAAEKQPHAISAVAFLAGQWRSEDGATEEHWSKPAGNNVMGMFRWLRPDGTPIIFEILTITEEKDGVYLRLRHFSPTLSATEEKEAPMTLRLAEASAHKAVFKAVPGETRLAAVTYSLPAKDTLSILVEFDGEREPLKFSLKRDSAK